MRACPSDLTLQPDLQPLLLSNGLADLAGGGNFMGGFYCGLCDAETGDDHTMVTSGDLASCYAVTLDEPTSLQLLPHSFPSIHNISPSLSYKFCLNAADLLFSLNRTTFSYTSQLIN